MSRSGYSDDYDNWSMIKWRGAVNSAIRGRRGQAFLKEMLAALDSLPVKCLIEGELETAGEVCALGAVGQKRGIGMTNVNPYDPKMVAGTFGISPALAAEIMYINDEGVGYWVEETPPARWQRVRNWVAGKIIEMP
jgi:hypothetical protein